MNYLISFLLVSFVTIYSPLSSPSFVLKKEKDNKIKRLVIEMPAEKKIHLNDTVSNYSNLEHARQIFGQNDLLDMFKVILNSDISGNEIK